MKRLEKWSLSYDNLNKTHRDFKLAISKFPLAEIAENVEEIIEKMWDLYSSVTKNVKEQDKQRELYSLVWSEVEHVKLHKFGGSLGEDFANFKSKLLLALEKNRFPVSDKVEKLRTCLSGQALAFVLEKTKDFNSALSILSDAFGNSEKVLSVRIAELKKLGKCPPETVNGKLNYSAIVAFCLNLEAMVKDLIDVAEADDGERQKFDVCSSRVRTAIQNLFSTRDIMKMRALKGKGKVGLEEHIKYVKDNRVKAQSMVKPEDIEDKSAWRKEQKRSDSYSTRKSIHAMFKSPRRLDDCRICGTLETMGETDLYVDHISKSVIRCPKFQAMSAD